MDIQGLEIIGSVVGGGLVVTALAWRRIARVYKESQDVTQSIQLLLSVVKDAGEEVRASAEVVEREFNKFRTTVKRLF